MQTFDRKIKKNLVPKPLNELETMIYNISVQHTKIEFFNRVHMIMKATLLSQRIVSWFLLFLCPLSWSIMVWMIVYLTWIYKVLKLSLMKCWVLMNRVSFLSRVKSEKKHQQHSIDCVVTNLLSTMQETKQNQTLSNVIQVVCNLMGESDLIEPLRILVEKYHVWKKKLKTLSTQIHSRETGNQFNPLFPWKELFQKPLWKTGHLVGKIIFIGYETLFRYIMFSTLGFQSVLLFCFVDKWVQVGFILYWFSLFVPILGLIWCKWWFDLHNVSFLNRQHNYRNQIQKVNHQIRQWLNYCLNHRVFFSSIPFLWTLDDSVLSSSPSQPYFLLIGLQHEFSTCLQNNDPQIQNLILEYCLPCDKLIRVHSQNIKLTLMEYPHNDGWKHCLITIDPSLVDNIFFYDLGDSSDPLHSSQLDFLSQKKIAFLGTPTRFSMHHHITNFVNL